MTEVQCWLPVGPCASPARPLRPGGLRLHQGGLFASLEGAQIGTGYEGLEPGYENWSLLVVAVASALQFRVLGEGH